MRSSFLGFCVATFAQAALLAQGPPVVLPVAAGIAKPPGGVSSTAFFFGTSATSTVLPNSHTQLIYDVGEVPPSAATWTSLSVRRPHGTVSANPAFAANATLILSNGLLPSTSASTTFANNLGFNKATVFTGQLSLPARPDPAQWPAVWEAPILFTVPFAYLKSSGASLVIDLHQTGNTGGRSWELEQTSRIPAGRVGNGSNLTCKFSNGQPMGSFSSGSPSVGGTWTVSYGGVPSGLIGFGAIGFAGVGETWNGTPLPLDLGPLGAPGCTWNVSVEIMTPMTGGSGATWGTVSVPANPGLAGQVFFDHTAFLDPLANPWGIATGISNKWIIGHATGMNPGTTLAAVGNAHASSVGLLSIGQVASVLLN